MAREPFVKYVGNMPQWAREHFFGLRDAQPALRAFALFDRIERGLPQGATYPEHMWSRYEIESYVTRPDVLLRMAAGDASGDLVTEIGRRQRSEAMEQAIREVEGAVRLFDEDPWGPDVKASERVLPPIFRLFYRRLGLDNIMDKSDFHRLVMFIEPAEIDPEVSFVLDRLFECIGEPP